jgi:hypothetical protein
MAPAHISLTAVFDGKQLFGKSKAAATILFFFH